MSWCWSICTLWPQHYNEASSWSDIVARKNPGRCGEVRIAGIRNPSQARRYRRRHRPRLLPDSGRTAALWRTDGLGHERTLPGDWLAWLC